jgi:hypothetical protein
MMAWKAGSGMTTFDGKEIERQASLLLLFIPERERERKRGILLPRMLA